MYPATGRTRGSSGSQATSSSRPTMLSSKTLPPNFGLQKWGWADTLQKRKHLSFDISYQIQHVKSSKNDAGRLYFDERFSLNNLSGVLLIELSMMARVEITCPMDFNWFPFDSQLCHFVIHSLVALFDISISNIDCRYIDTFKKYRYQYRYRYGHFWKYRYR